jgi:hypothetical protein
MPQTGADQTKKQQTKSPQILQTGYGIQMKDLRGLNSGYKLKIIMVPLSSSQWLPTSSTLSAPWASGLLPPSIPGSALIRHANSLRVNSKGRYSLRSLSVSGVPLLVL